VIIKVKGENKKSIHNPQELFEILQKVLLAENRIDQDKEHFWSIGVDTRNRIKYIELVSLGTLNSSLVHPREMFRLAVIKGVASVILAHNHPSGDVEPSGTDLEVTNRLVKAGEILGIGVLDHIIISKDTYYSFADNNLIEKVK